MDTFFRDTPYRLPMNIINIDCLLINYKYDRTFLTLFLQYIFMTNVACFLICWITFNLVHVTYIANNMDPDQSAPLALKTPAKNKKKSSENSICFCRLLQILANIF